MLTGLSGTLRQRDAYGMTRHDGLSGALWARRGLSAAANQRTCNFGLPRGASS